jgi:hypothetical protein
MARDFFLTRMRGPFSSIRSARHLLLAVFGTQRLVTLIWVYGVLMTPLVWDEKKPPIKYRDAFRAPEAAT